MQAPSEKELCYYPGNRAKIRGHPYIAVINFIGKRKLMAKTELVYFARRGDHLLAKKMPRFCRRRTVHQ